MASAKCVLVLSLLSVLLISEASGYFWNPCKFGYYLTNPRVGRPLYCNGWTGCPWPRYYKCRSLTGSDDGFGICCYDPGALQVPGLFTNGWGFKAKANCKDVFR